MAHIFISYSKQDIDFTRHLKRSLEEAGFVVWMDETAVRPSARWWPTIERNIETSAAVVVVMSPNSRESDWVEREILYAERLRKPIFPVLLTGEDWPRLANIQYTDMRTWKSGHLPTELEDMLNGVVVPSKLGDVSVPLDLPGELIPEMPTPQPRAQSRSWLIWVMVLILVAGGALVGGIALGNRQSDDPTPTEKMAINVATLVTQSSESPKAPPTVTTTDELAATVTEEPTEQPTATATEEPDPTLTEEPTATATEEPTTTPTKEPTATATEVSTAIPTLAVGSSNDVWEPVVGMYNTIPMVYVPAGCFTMGLASGEHDQFPHDVCLSAFWISQTEITNQQYRFCVNEGGCEPPHDVSYYNSSVHRDYPVVYVDWFQAAAFATWLGGSLPTEAQWEYAARGPEAGDYPWGTASVRCEQANIRGCEGDIAPVGSEQRSTGASWIGALDMAGNVWEWTQDWYNADYYFTLPPFALDPSGPDEPDTVRVIRGGSWDDTYPYAHSAYRNYNDGPHDQSDSLGFRVVLPAEALDLP